MNFVPCVAVWFHRTLCRCFTLMLQLFAMVPLNLELPSFLLFSFVNANNKAAVSLFIQLGIFGFVFSLCCSIRRCSQIELSSQCFLSLIIHHSTTHFHQSCCQCNSVAPFLHPDGSQYLRLKLLLPWSQHLHCCHKRPRDSQQQLRFQ